MKDIDVPKHLRHLHNAIGTLAADSNVALGKELVLTATVLALVETHPDPEQFAQALRRVWFRLGQPHTGDDADPQLIRGIDEMLSMVEEACPVPLNLRPPRDDSRTQPSPTGR